MEPWTVRKLLGWTVPRFREAGFEAARLDADLLLAHSMGVERMGLYMDYDRVLLAPELDKFRDFVRRRLDGEPVAYLTGRKEFWSLDLHVDKRVLIPRPDTETLVEAAIEHLKGVESPRVLDVGTGSGAIALAIAKERGDAQVLACDISQAAVDVATENAQRLELPVQFFVGDLFAPIAERGFALIASNPPYLLQGEIDTKLGFEPRGALTAEDDGLSMTRRLIEESPDRLAPGGVLLIEVGGGRSSQVAEAFRSSDRFGEPTIRVDMAGLDRVVGGAATGLTGYRPLL